jgi:small-conductance mechanosensitive channel
MTPQDASVEGLIASGLSPLEALWLSFVNYLPQLFAAVVILTIGWAVAAIVGRILENVLRSIGIDRALQRIDAPESTRVAMNRYPLSSMLASAVKWLLIIASVGVAADALNLTQVNQFVGAIFAYIPNVLVAAIILAIGFVASRIVGDFIATAVNVSRFPFGNRIAVSSVARYAIIAFAIMASLTQLNVVPRLIDIFFAGLVFALALAFGLGGRDHASDALRTLREQRQS